MEFIMGYELLSPWTAVLGLAKASGDNIHEDSNSENGKCPFNAHDPASRLR